MLNIGSIILGVVSWIFAILAINTPKPKISHRNTILSFSLCISSLLFQLFEINRRVSLSDYAAIEDTIRAVTIASITLTTITIVLNVIALIKLKTNESN